MVFFDLNRIRRDQTLLDDPEMMKYFVVLNNCSITRRDPRNEVQRTIDVADSITAII